MTDTESKALNKHQEIAIEAMEEMVEHSMWHSAIERYNGMTPEQLQQKDNAEMFSFIKERLAEVRAAIYWIKSQS